MYSYIMSFFTTESLERVKQDTDFIAAEADKDPVLLIPIWRRILTKTPPQHCILAVYRATPVH